MFLNECFDLLDLGLSELLPVVLQHAEEDGSALVVSDLEVDPREQGQVVADALVPLQDSRAEPVLSTI